MKNQIVNKIVIELLLEEVAGVGKQFISVKMKTEFLGGNLMNCSRMITIKYMVTKSQLIS